MRGTNTSSGEGWAACRARAKLLAPAQRPACPRLPLPARGWVLAVPKEVKQCHLPAPWSKGGGNASFFLPSWEFYQVHFLAVGFLFCSHLS